MKVSRRKFIGLIPGACIGCMIAAGCRGGDPGEQEARRRPVRLVPVAELKEGPNLFRTERVAVFRNGAEVSAVSMVCTHQECLLVPGGGQGVLFLCPCHGSEFGPSGARLSGPALRDLPWYGLSISGGVLEVDFSRLVDSTWRLQIPG